MCRSLRPRRHDDAPRRAVRTTQRQRCGTSPAPRGTSTDPLYPIPKYRWEHMWWRGKVESESVAFLGRPHISLGIGGEQQPVGYEGSSCGFDTGDIGFTAAIAFFE